MIDKPKILIVDDKPENLFALENVLGELDVGLIKATNGNDALKEMLNHQFALAILDVHMPEMDGYELAELIRGEDKTKYIPIIFLSAVYSDEFHVFKGYKSGAVDFLTKPYNPEILLDKVKVFIELDIKKREQVELAKYLRKSHTYIKLLQKIAVIANQSESVEEALQYSVERVCETTSWPIGHVYIAAHENSDELKPTSIWHLEDKEHFKTFYEVTMKTKFARGIGLPGRVLESGKAEWITDVTKDANFPRAKVVKEIGVRGAFCFPVLVKEKVSAVLEFFSTEASEPDEELIPIMTQVGTQLGRVIERRNMEQEKAIQTKVALMSAEVGSAITKNNTLQSILQLCTETIVRNLNTAFARIWTVNRDKNMLELQASAGMYTHIDGDHARIPVGQKKIGLIVKDRKPFVTNKPLDDIPGIDKDWAKREGMAAFAGYPLIVEDQVIGVIGTFSRDPLPAIVLKSLALVASGIAIGIKRKQEEEKINKYASEMEQLAEERSRQLIHADRMITLGTLSAGIAHEINNPVGFVSNNLQIFEKLWDQSIRAYLEKAKGKNEDKNLSFALDEMPRMLKAMKEGIRRIINIVHGLGKFSRITKPVFEISDICEVIEAAVKFCRLDLTLKHKVKIQLDLPNDIPNIEISRQEIEQVLINLITNSGHAMEDITDRKELILKIAVSHVNNNIVIEITDNGHGMDEKTLDNIFNPFFTTKEVGKGTGLGLSVCCGIIEQHRGDITARSTLGEGTTFTITLPIDPQKKERRKKDEKNIDGMRDEDRQSLN